MDRERRLRKKAEFLNVQRQGRWWANSLATISVLPNELGANRFGFLVSRRVGGAVVRNLVKRRLKEIVRREILLEGFDVVLIARAALQGATFAQAGDAVRDLFRRSRLLSGSGLTGSDLLGSEKRGKGRLEERAGAEDKGRREEKGGEQA